MKSLNIHLYKLKFNILTNAVTNIFYDIYIHNIKDIDILINIKSDVLIVDKQYNYVTSTYFTVKNSLKLFNMQHQNHFMAKENEIAIKLLYQKLYGL